MAVSVDRAGERRVFALAERRPGLAAEVDVRAEGVGAGGVVRDGLELGARSDGLAPDGAHSAVVVREEGRRGRARVRVRARARPTTEEGARFAGIGGDGGVGAGERRGGVRDRGAGLLHREEAEARPVRARPGEVGRGGAFDQRPSIREVVARPRGTLAGGGGRERRHAVRTRRRGVGAAHPVAVHEVHVAHVVGEAVGSGARAGAHRAAEPEVRDAGLVVVGVVVEAVGEAGGVVPAAHDLHRRVAVADGGLRVELDFIDEAGGLARAVRDARREAFAHRRAAVEVDVVCEAGGAPGHGDKTRVAVVIRGHDLRERGAAGDLAARHRHRVGEPRRRAVGKRLDLRRAIDDADVRAAHGPDEAEVLAGGLLVVAVRIGLGRPDETRVAVGDEHAVADGGDEARRLAVAVAHDALHGEVAQLRARRERGERRSGPFGGDAVRAGITDGVPLPEELALEIADALEVMVGGEVLGEVEVVHQHVGVRCVVGDGKEVLDRVDGRAERRADGGDVADGVGGLLRERVGEALAHPAGEGAVRVGGDGADGQHRADRVGLARRLAVHEDRALAGDDRRREPEVRPAVRGRGEIGAGGEAVRRVPDVVEIIVRHRRGGRVGKLRLGERADARVVAAIVAVADVAHVRFGGTPAIDEVRVVRVVDVAAEGSGVPRVAAVGRRGEREATRDGGAGGVVADGRGRDEAGHPCARVHDRRGEDGVAVLDGRIVGDRRSEARAAVPLRARQHRADAAADGRAYVDTGGEAVGVRADRRDAVSDAVLRDCAFAERGGETGGGFEHARGAAAAEHVGAAVLAAGVGELHETDDRFRIGDGAVLVEGVLRVGVAGVARGIAGGADESRALRRDVAHRAALEGAVPCHRSEAGIHVAEAAHGAADEGVGADAVRDDRPVFNGRLVGEEAAEDALGPFERFGGAVDEPCAGGGDVPRESARAVGEVHPARRIDGARGAVGEGLRAGRPADEAAEEAVGRLDRSLERAVVEGRGAVGEAGRAAGGGVVVVGVGAEVEGAVDEVVVGDGILPVDEARRRAVAELHVGRDADESAAAAHRRAGDGAGRDDGAGERAVREPRFPHLGGEAAERLGVRDRARHGAVVHLDAPADADETAGPLVRGDRFGVHGRVRNDHVHRPSRRVRPGERFVVHPAHEAAGVGIVVGVRRALVVDDRADEVAVLDREAGHAVGGPLGVFRDRAGAPIRRKRGGAPVVPERREADVALERDVLHDRAGGGDADERAAAVDVVGEVVDAVARAVEHALEFVHLAVLGHERAALAVDVGREREGRALEVGAVLAVLVVLHALEEAELVEVLDEVVTLVALARVGRRGAERRGVLHDRQGPGARRALAARVLDGDADGLGAGTARHAGEGVAGHGEPGRRLDRPRVGRHAAGGGQVGGVEFAREAVREVGRGDGELGDPVALDAVALGAGAELGGVRDDPVVVVRGGHGGLIQVLERRRVDPGDLRGGGVVVGRGAVDGEPLGPARFVPGNENAPLAHAGGGFDVRHDDGRGAGGLVAADVRRGAAPARVAFDVGRGQEIAVDPVAAIDAERGGLEVVVSGCGIDERVVLRGIDEAVDPVVVVIRADALGIRREPVDVLLVARRRRVAGNVGVVEDDEVSAAAVRVRRVFRDGAEVRRGVGNARAAAEVLGKVEHGECGGVERHVVLDDEAVLEDRFGRAAAHHEGGVVGDRAAGELAEGRAAAQERPAVADHAVGEAAADDCAAAARGVVGTPVLDREPVERAVGARQRVGALHGALGIEHGVVALDDRRFGAIDAHEMENAALGVDCGVRAGRNAERVAVLRRVNGVLQRRAAAGDGRRVALEAGRHNMVGVDVGERERRARTRLHAVHEPFLEGAPVRGRRDRGGTAVGDDKRALRDVAPAIDSHGDNIPFHAALVAANVRRVAGYARISGKVGAAIIPDVVRIAAVDAGRTGAKAVVAVRRVDEARVAGERRAAPPNAVFVVEVRLVKAVVVVNVDKVVCAAVGGAVAVEHAVVGSAAVERATVVGAVADDGAVVKLRVFRRAALVAGVEAEETVVGDAAVQAAAVADVVRDRASEQHRAERAAAVGGDAVLEDAVDEHAALRTRAAVVLIGADAFAVLERKACEHGQVREERAARGRAAVDDRGRRAGDADDVHVLARRVNGIVGSGRHGNALARLGGLDGLANRLERLRPRPPVVVAVDGLAENRVGVLSVHGVHEPFIGLEGGRHDDVFVAGRDDRQRIAARGDEDAVRVPRRDGAVVGGGVGGKRDRHVRVREDASRRDDAIAVRDGRHEAAFDARALVAAAVDGGALDTCVASEVGRADILLGRVGGVAAVDRRRADAQAVVAVAHELRVHGVVLLDGLSGGEVAPDDAVVAAIDVDVGAPSFRDVVHHRAVVERHAVGEEGLSGRLAHERVAVRALLGAGTAAARRGAAPDDAAQGVGAIGAAAPDRRAVLDHAVDERAARRAATV